MVQRTAICINQLRHSAVTLGLRNGAQLADCKAAYRGLAKQCHPDILNKQNTQRSLDFREVGDAYQVLLRYFAEQKTLYLPAFEHQEEQQDDEYEAEKEEWYRQQFENANRDHATDEP